MSDPEAELIERLRNRRAFGTFDGYKFHVENWPHLLPVLSRQRGQTMKLYKRITRTTWQPVEHLAGRDDDGWPNTVATVCVKTQEYVELSPQDGIFLTGKQLAFTLVLVFLIFLSSAIQW